MTTKLIKKGISAVGKEIEELVIFNPSNAPAISEAMGKLVKRSKQYAKDARTDLFRFTELSLPVLAEMQNSKQVVSVQTVKAVLWTASGQSIPKSGSPEYKYASEITLKAVRSAIMIHDKKGFKLMNGQLQVLEKVDQPMVRDTDQFGTKIDGTSVPNPSVDYKPVQDSSITKYFGAIYPDSVEVRGTKKPAGVNQQNPASKDQVLTDFAHKISDTGPSTIVECQTILAVLNSNITKNDMYTQIEALANGEPTAVANVA
jgi:hypothetical protein